MDDPKHSDDDILNEIRRMLDELDAKFKERTSDPDNFATFSELEGMLGNLINSTAALYAMKLKSMAEEAGEKASPIEDEDKPDGDKTV
ncbi:MAG: hypothetical protein LUD50_02170 [Clostridia bacterium]|nr:hypothetical protein [Clostridia bacterium]